MMDFIGIFMLIITYVLIGFGFACGLALFRYVAKMWRRRKKRQAETTPKVSGTERILRRL